MEKTAVLTYQTQLLELLLDHFNEAELRDLYFVLNLEYGDFGGRGRSRKRP